jgi:pyruvate kinase
MTRRAKIVATLGPASEDAEIILRLLEEGVDVVRLNLSHGTAEGHRNAVSTVRRVSGEAGLYIPVILDLMGPRYRLSRQQPPTVLRKDSIVRIAEQSEDAELMVDDPDILSALRPQERILIDNGLVELQAETVSEGRVTARVLTGGTVDSRKGINLPDSELPFTISPKDRADIALAVGLGVDYIAASYVGSAGDLETVRAAVHEVGGKIPLIAKLERARAVENLSEIVAAADAVMVARGDLGVEVPLHTVPILQKQIISSGQRHGKPVIVATQMLESMMTNARPTRAESSDVANAVFDGADALMLSGESAVGRHPIQVVRTMNRIICEAEAYGRSAGPKATSIARLAATDLPTEAATAPSAEEAVSPSVSPFEIADTIAAAAVHAARTLGLRHIVAFSQGGFTARVISRYRPAAPIWMLTTMESVARRVQLSWGVRPLLLSQDVEHHDEIIDRVDSELLRHGIANPGDAIAVLMGDPIRERPLTNLLRIHRVRDRQGDASRPRPSSEQ